MSGSTCKNVLRKIGLYTKVIGSRSRSWEQKGRRCRSFSAVIDFDGQFSSVLAMWHHRPRVTGGRALD